MLFYAGLCPTPHKGRRPLTLPKELRPSGLPFMEVGVNFHYRQTLPKIWGKVWKLLLKNILIFHAILFVLYLSPRIFKSHRTVKNKFIGLRILINRKISHSQKLIMSSRRSISYGRLYKTVYDFKGIFV